MSEREGHVFDAIYARRSIRRYIEGKQVEQEKIEKLLMAAMAAPSACNIQPWEFIVITERKMIDDIKPAIIYGNYNAPLVMVVCGNPKFIPWENDVGEADCAAAVENMLIAATAMGLGSVWIGGYDQGKVRELLNVPENVWPVAIVYFGYPDENPEPRSQYVPEAVHWGRYDADRAYEKRAGCIV